MRGQNWGSLAVGAVLIPIAAGWTWPYGREPVLLCLRCRKQIPGSSKFCPNCGLDLYGTPRPGPPSATTATVSPSFCTACGRPLKQGARFCGSCGAAV